MLLYKKKKNSFKPSFLGSSNTHVDACYSLILMHISIIMYIILHKIQRGRLLTFSVVVRLLRFRFNAGMLHIGKCVPIEDCTED